MLSLARNVPGLVPSVLLTQTAQPHGCGARVHVPLRWRRSDEGGVRPSEAAEQCLNIQRVARSLTRPGEAEFECWGLGAIHRLQHPWFLRCCVGC